MNLSSTAREALALRILKDLRISQTSASATSERLNIPTALVESIAADLVHDGFAETASVGDCITVYRASRKGLELIS
jgi:DNA-binding IscR family transcriptional regulator